MNKYRIEMTQGQDQRLIEADSWREDDNWLVFYRKPSQGGIVEYWRAQSKFVVCIETVKA